MEGDKTEKPQSLESSLIGKKFGPYFVQREIGRGGMGIIFEAYDKALDRPVALKVLPLHALDEESKKRFIQEARAVAKLEHPNITSVYSVGKIGNFYYIAFQYIKGKNLLHILRENGPLPVKEALLIAKECAKALNEAHKHNILHRDVKTENIMIDQEGKIKLLDFGIAKDLNLRANLTNPSIYLGTPEYCSPEQFRGEKCDERTDIYSLGVVLYELLTGKIPYSNKETRKIYEQAVEEQREGMRRLNPSIPRSVDRFVCRLLSKERENRPLSMESVIKEIRLLLLERKALGVESKKGGAGILKESAIFFKDLKDRVINILF